MTFKDLPEGSIIKITPPGDGEEAFVFTKESVDKKRPLQVIIRRNGEVMEEEDVPPDILDQASASMRDRVE